MGASFDPTFWHWWILAAALIAIEVLAPGTFFLWLGIAAAVTGLIKLVAPGLGWEFQAMIFAISSILAIWGGRVWFGRHQTASDRPNLNRRGAEYVGRHFDLADPIVSGSGKLAIDGVIWRVVGEDMPAGTSVTVVAIDGTSLKVDRA